jgi:peptidyl-prolyl cis-trans isomerase B (cyclophilin B)
MHIKAIALFTSLVFLFGSCSSPKAGFMTSSESFVAPSYINFINQSKKSSSYLWDFGDGSQSTEISPKHLYRLSGNYSVILKAINGKKVNIFNRNVKIEAPHDCLVEMKTSHGTMIIKLHDATPLHRDNFLKLVEENFYDGLLFHRVIKGFMVQAGDPQSKHAKAEDRLGTGGPGYTIPAEIKDTLVHIKGALAAARMGDDVNPTKASSGSQFYIVHGRKISQSQLENFEMQKNIYYSSGVKNLLTQVGGAPALDKEYTVFGQVIKGLDVIDKIAESQTDASDRPIEDVKIISTKIIH